MTGEVETPEVIGGQAMDYFKFYELTMARHLARRRNGLGNQ
jgi:hypothetical protein